MARSCARPACGGPATTTLSYDYANATVWIEPLHAERHPMRHDLCERHAARLSVPRGWTLVDRRAVPKVDGVDAHGRAHESARTGDLVWDPSGTLGDVAGGVGTVEAEPEVTPPAAGGELPDEGAIVLEPTLFGDWSAEDDQQSIAS